MSVGIAGSEAQGGPINRSLADAAAAAGMQGATAGDGGKQDIAWPGRREGGARGDAQR